MLTRARGMNGIPFDVLCDIVQRCADGNIYKLAILRAVNKDFSAAVAMIGSSLAIANMRYRFGTGVSHPSWRGDEVVKGVLERCPNLVVLLLICRHDYSELRIKILLSYMPNTLSILQMHHCHMSIEVLLELGRALPHLQGLSLCSAHIDDSYSSPWGGFPQLRFLRVDWMTTVNWKCLRPLRSQLLYLSCHGCMAIDDGICDGLDSCVALDLGHNRISDDGLRTLLDKGAPRLKLLLLNTKSDNLWEDGQWTPAMVKRMQERGVRVIQSAGYGTNRSAVEDCLQEVLCDSSEVFKYAAKYVF